MKAGKLRHVVTIEERGSERDSNGEIIESWTDAFGVSLRAGIAPLSGRELLSAQAEQAEITTRITMRYLPGVQAEMRVVHRDLVYAIRSVVPDPESGEQWITLLCTSGVVDEG
jgi:SPP1 family predicted phage head-tail adaptor